MSNFEGLYLGDITIGSSTLVLSGAELNTFKSSGGDVTAAEIQYRVYEQGQTPGAFNAVGINFTANATFNDAASNTYSNTGDQKWASIVSTPNLLSGITEPLIPTVYEVEVYLRAFTNEGDRFSNAGGSNYTASFNVIPEPSSIVMLSLTGLAAGGLALLKRRKRA